MRLSLRARIFIGSLLLVTLTVIGIGVPLVIAVRAHALDETDARMKQDAFVAASLMVDGMRTGNRDLVARRARDVSTSAGARVSVTDPAGRLVFDTSDERRDVEDFSNRPEIQVALSGQPAVEVRHSETLGADLLAVAVPIAAGGHVYGVVRLLEPLSQVRRDQQRATLGVIGIALLLIIAGAGMSSVISRSVTRPVEDIARMADAIGEGDLTARTREGGPPEIRKLAESMNDSAARVQAAVATERSFIGNAAHQLRTPLTALGLRLDTLAADPSLTPSRLDDITAARAELSGLARLLDQLLILSRTSESGAILLAHPVDIRPAIENVAATWKERLADAGTDLNVAIERDLPLLRIPPELIADACENLLDNVLLYAGGCETADLAAYVRGGNLVISVADTGDGMPSDVSERAFARFTRGSSGQPGTGLGLAVVRQVAEAAGGSAEIESSESGTTVTMKLPVERPRDQAEPASFPPSSSAR